MMKNLLMSLAVLLSITLITSCGNDDEMMDTATCSDGVQNGTETGVDCGGDCALCPTTVAEDMANVQQSVDDLASCADDIKDGRAIDELFRKFLNMADGYATNEGWIEDMTEGLENSFDIDHLDNNARLDVSYHAGTYTFEASNFTWSKANDVTDKIVFKFPSEPSSTTNNVELLLDVYTDELVTVDGGEEVYLPKTAHVLMNVDGIKTFELTISKVTYAGTSGYQLPVELNAEFFMDPMTITMNVDKTSTTAYEMDMSMADGNLCDIGMSAQMELNDDNFENLDVDDLQAAAVQINLGDLSFRTMGDLAALLALEDPTEAQVNSLADLDVYFQDVKIGDIEYSEAMETLLIYYKDQTSENFDDILSDIEDILAEFFG